MIYDDILFWIFSQHVSSAILELRITNNHYETRTLHLWQLQLLQWKKIVPFGLTICDVTEELMAATLNQIALIPSIRLSRYITCIVQHRTLQYFQVYIRYNYVIRLVLIFAESVFREQYNWSLTISSDNINTHTRVRFFIFIAKTNIEICVYLLLAFFSQPSRRNTTSKVKRWHVLCCCCCCFCCNTPAFYQLQESWWCH